MQEQSKTKDRLGTILKSKGYVTDQQLMEVMEYQLRIPCASFDTAELSPSLSEYIPPSLARKHKMVPIKVLDKKLFLAIDDVLDFIAIEDARVVSGMEINPMIAPEQLIESARNKIYGDDKASSAIKELTEESMDDVIQINHDHNTVLSNAPIVRLVNSIFERAANAKASDIYVEPS